MMAFTTRNIQQRQRHTTQMQMRWLRPQLKLPCNFRSIPLKAFHIQLSASGGFRRTDRNVVPYVMQSKARYLRVRTRQPMTFCFAERPTNPGDLAVLPGSSGRFLIPAGQTRFPGTHDNCATFAVRRPLQSLPTSRCGPPVCSCAGTRLSRNHRRVNKTNETLLDFTAGCG